MATDNTTKPIANDGLYARIVYAEYVFLSLSFIFHVLLLSVTPPSRSVSLWVATACLFLLALLAPLRPLRWNSSVRAGLIMVDCILLTGAVWYGMARLILPLYIVIVAKAALLLRLRMVIAFVFLAWCCQFGCEYFKLRSTQPEMNIAIAVAFMITIGPLLLMLACGFALSSLDAERRSRQEAEALSKEVESLAKQLERARIKREIHDVIGHFLTSMRIQLEVASRYASLDEAEARQAVDHAKELAGQALKEIRAVLHSTNVEWIDLHDALRKLVSEINKTKALIVESEIDAGELSNDIALEVYRIIQEGLTNVLRHAKANHCAVRVERKDDSLHVIISDDGKGFDEGDSRGLGITGIFERVHQLGGKIDLSNSETGGAIVSCIIPVKEAKSQMEKMERSALK